MTIVRSLLVSFGLLAAPVESKANDARKKRLADFEQWLGQLKDASGYHVDAHYLEAIDGLEQVILASTSTGHRDHLLEDFRQALFLIFMKRDSFDGDEPVYNDAVREKAKEIFLTLCPDQTSNFKPLLRLDRDEKFLRHCMGECREMLEEHPDGIEADVISNVMKQVSGVINEPVPPNPDLIL